MRLSMFANLLVGLPVALLSAQAAVAALEKGNYYLNDFDQLRSIGVLSGFDGLIGTLSSEEKSQQWSVNPIEETSPGLYQLMQDNQYARPSQGFTNVQLDYFPFVWKIELASSGSGCYIISTPTGQFDHDGQQPPMFNWFISSSDVQKSIPVTLNSTQWTEICFTT